MGTTEQIYVCRFHTLRCTANFSAPSRTRTYNLLVKSQLLYQLSYKGVNRGAVSPALLTTNGSSKLQCSFRRMSRKGLSVILHPNSFSPCEVSCSNALGETRTRKPLRATDFKSVVYTDSTTRANFNCQTSSTHLIYQPFIYLSTVTFELP